MKLFAIYTLDESLMQLPLLIKIDEKSSAIAAFQDESNAQLYVRDVLISGKYEVLELTLDDFNKQRTATRKHSGVDTFIRVFD